MIQFEADKKHLTYLLSQIEHRDLGLPDFQRSFVWDASATRELVVSIIRSFPAGSLLLLQGGAETFAPREFEEAPKLDGPPVFLVLDGQQRLTSLYQVFSGTGSHRFFLNLKDLLNGSDVDEAVEVYTLSRGAKRWGTIGPQARDLMLPLNRLRGFADWKDEVLEALEGTDVDRRKLSKQLNELDDEYVKPVEQYQFPVTTLSATTPSEAVCTIFETLNRTGLKLSVFELITARAFAKEVRLRDMWEDVQAEHEILSDFGIDPYYVLQVIALMKRGSPKRGVVLALAVESIVEEWDTAVSGLADVLRMLRDECGVLVAKWLPYYTMLIPMAAAWGSVIKKPGPAVGGRRDKLKRWFWCSVFTGAYENNPNSTAERDSQELVAWMEERGPEPTALRSFSFDPERWREITYKQRALYRASIALLMRHHPLDFHEAKPLTRQSIEEDGVDDHHIFPRNYLRNAVKGEVVDSVLNHTLIDRKTNIRISDHAPKKYLSEMEEELHGKLGAVLRSHKLPADPDGSLLGNRFEDFLEWRIDQLTEELSEATGSEQDDHGILWSGLTEEKQTGEKDEDDVDVIPSEVVSFLNTRVGQDPKRATVDSFLQQTLSWRGVQASVARSQKSKDGWGHGINVTRQGFGARFMAVFPRAMKVVYRLSEEDIDGVDPVEIRNVRPTNPYRIRGSLKGPAGFDACLDLARRAYQRTFEERGNVAPADEEDEP